MKNLKSIIWGLVLITLGIIIGLNAFEIINVDIFFDGWWTLFIIVPCFIGIITEENKLENIIGLIIGIGLLLWRRDVIEIGRLWKLIVPIILILVGISCIFKGKIDKKIESEIQKINKTNDNNYCTVFSGQEVNLSDEKFDGANLTSVFGGIDLDLRNAKINSDTVIDVKCVFGGADILVPDNVKVKISSSSFFGGVDNKKKNIDDQNKKYTLYIKATCVFGGVDIK